MEESNFYVRNEKVCGIGPWLWPKEKYIYLNSDGESETDGGLWHGPKLDFEICHQFLVLNACKHFDVVVQAGGGCGMYPRLLAQRFKYIYTFEPNYLNFFCLTNNCPMSNIFKMQAALGNENKMVGMCFRDSNYGESVIVDENMIENKMLKGELQGTIPMLRIDQLGLWKCDLIWLDIERYEIYALRGAVETIKKFRPTVVVECGDLHGIPEFMESLNYTFQGMSMADYIYVPSEFLK